MAQRTGQYKAMNEFIVPEGAFESFNPMTGELKVDWSKADPSKPAAGYGFYFKLVNGFEKTVYWTKEQCETHGRKYSQVYKKFGSGLWATDFDAMALKTVIKTALSKYGPLSIQMQTAMESDQSVINIDDEGNTHFGYNDNTEKAEPMPVQAEVSDLEPAKPKPKPKAKPKPAIQEDPAPDPTPVQAEAVQDKVPTENSPLGKLKDWVVQNGVIEDQLLNTMKTQRFCDDSISSLNDLTEAQIDQVLTFGDEILSRLS